jgi:hypothetical protein
MLFSRKRDRRQNRGRLDFPAVENRGHSMLLPYIINSDIKYRMGRDTGEEEGK